MRLFWGVVEVSISYAHACLVLLLNPAGFSCLIVAVAAAGAAYIYTYIYIYIIYHIYVLLHIPPGSLLHDHALPGCEIHWQKVITAR